MACKAPSHDLNRRWLVNWTIENKFHRIVNQNTIIFIQDAFDNVICKKGGHFIQGSMY